MATEVQTSSVHGSTTVTLPANVTAGNSVLLAVTAFNSGGGSVISSSSPTYGGNPVAGAVKLTENQSSAAANPNIYSAIWLLPALPAGSNSIAITYVNGFASLTAATEWAGLGSSPAAGPVNTGAAVGTAAVTSGALTALARAAAVTGIAGTSANLSAAPGAPWTSVLNGNDCSGFIADTAGDTPVFTPAMAGAANWSASIAAVYGPAAAGGTDYDDDAPWHIRRRR